MSLTGLIVKGFVSSELGEHLSFSQKSLVDPASRPVSTKRHKSILCSSLKSPQRPTQIRHGGVTGVHKIHQCLHPSAQHQRTQCNSLNYRQQVCSHASGGNRLPTRLPLCHPGEKKHRIRLIARLDKLPHQQLHINDRTKGHSGQQVV